MRRSSAVCGSGATYPRPASARAVPAHVSRPPAVEIWPENWLTPGSWLMRVFDAKGWSATADFHQNLVARGSDAVGRSCGQRPRYQRADIGLHGRRVSIVFGVYS